ncbi:hypothetical protein D1157_08225 [Anaerotruncus sp. X29]|nr:hypothetical protein [Anaerotruncus sp. X29]
MNTFREYGKTGLFRFDTGWIYEEFLRELQGRKGIEVYKEMSENDDIIGAILFATEMLMRQSKWSIQEAGTEQADLDAAEFVRTCMDDMEETWSDFISEVLSFMTYGWSYHEIVYKWRMGRSKNPETNSKYTDGLIGWRKLPIRSQDTLWEWKYDEKDNLIGLVQCAPPLYEQVFIPIEKALHFKTKSRKGNPEGRSVLRNCYRNWYFKRRIQEIEGIGIERDLAGLPVLEAPEGVDIWSDEYAAELAKAERIVRSVRRDEREGIVLGNGWKFSLTSTGGRRQFDTNQIIERYDTRMAMTVLADFVLLGHQAVGSFALSSDKTELFGVALGAFLDLICEVFNNQAIPRLIDINGEHFAGITDYPILTHGDIETQDLGQLGEFVSKMVGIGAITPDESMEDYLRLAADLPERDPETAYMGNQKPPEQPQDGGAGDGKEQQGNEPEAPPVDPQEGADGEEKPPDGEDEE